MSDTITIRELVAVGNENMFAWAVFHLMSEATGAAMPDMRVDIRDKFNLDVKDHENTVTIEMRVNGVEVSPREIFKRLGETHDEMLKQQAMKILREKCNASTDLLDKVEQLVRREASRALGIDWEDRW